MCSLIRSTLILHLCRQSVRPKYLFAAGYKSQYNIEKLYPNSDLSYGSSTVLKHTQADEQTFSGVIPVKSLDIRYSRSGGPGGQHVNKVSSKVEMRFHVQTAAWIPDWVKPNLKEQERGRITKDGYMIVISDKTRKQILNQADCLDKIRGMIRSAAVKPAEPTDEELEKTRQRKLKAREAVLKQKKSHSLKKMSRQGPSIHSV